jgi:hypothetical protein
MGTRRQVSRGQLARDARIAWEAEKRREAVRRGREKAAREKAAPSETIGEWQRRDPADWTPRDVVGFYAAQYLEVMGREDISLSKTSMGRAVGNAKALLEKLDAEGIDPKEYVTWAVAYCRQPGSYPKDGIPSMTVLVYDWIVLKAFTARNAPRGRRPAPRNAATRRGGDSWVEGS